jgi:protein TonB
LTIKKFFVFSILVHSIVFFGIYFLPADFENKQEEFYAMLISPEEVLKPEIRPHQKKIEPLQEVLPFPEQIKPMPSLQQTRGIAPQTEIPPINTLPPSPPTQETPPIPQVEPLIKHKTPSPEKPVVPGEGKDTGKPLPEGTYPENSIEDKKEKGGIFSKDALRPDHSVREKLFDKDIIGDIAKKDFDKFDEKADTDNSITFDTKEYRYAGYLKKLKERIQGIWVYPPEASARGIYGDLRIRFTIKKNGKLGEIELVRTSGYKMLDDAAMKALKNGEPYWPLPDDWGVESYTIVGHFVYYIYGFYIR